MKKQTLVFLIVTSVFFCHQVSAQSQFGINTDNPKASAVLEIVSTDKGVLIPRLSTTQRTSIASPDTGLMVYDSVLHHFFYYDGSAWLQIRASTITTIADSDNDTKIQAEESADEDILRFDMGGMEWFTMDSGRLNVLNTGASVFMGQEAGANDDLSSNQNVFIGYQAGKANTTGYFNTATGYRALTFNTSGNYNTAIGHQALKNNTTGLQNTATGYGALFSNTFGLFNTATGYQALNANTSGADNNAIGYKALSGNTTGNENTAVGSESLTQNSTGTYNTAIGNSALRENTTGKYNAAIGFQALYANTTGYYNAAFGNGALYLNTTDSNNTALGFEAGRNASGKGNVLLGYQAGYNASGGNQLFIDNSNTATPLIWGDFQSDSVKIYGTLNINNAFSFPTTDGTYSGQMLQTDGDGNVTWQFSNRLSDGDFDTHVYVEQSPDEDIIRFITSGLEKFSMQDGRLNMKNNGSSVFIGEDAGLNDDQSSNNNVFIGFHAGTLNTTGYNNLAVGYNALANNTTGFANSASGHQALNKNTTGSLNTANGYRALYDNTTGNQLVALGYAALTSNSTGGTNTALGYFALHDNTIGSGNTATGNNALYNNSTGFSNTANGKSALYSNTTGIYNTAVGADALYANTTDSNSTAIGYQAGYNATGKGNVFIGYKAGYDATGGQQLFIDNSNTTTPLVWGDFANDSLKVFGTLNINDAFNFPTSDGSSGQHLQTDGVGNVTWATNNILADADMDTKVNVEESADEDIIRFYLGGTQTWIMTGSSLEPRNNGQSLFVGNGAGEVDDLTNNRNVFLGYQAGQANTSGYYNNATGYRALYANTTGQRNTAMGFEALVANTTGNINTGIGSRALYSNSTGAHNTAIGYRTLYTMTADSMNTAIGHAAGRNASGNGNVLIGYQAGYDATGGNKLFIDNSNTTTPLIWGDFATDQVGINRVATTNTLEVGGDASKSVAGSWAANSDKRLKKNIHYLNSSDILQKVLQMKGVSYEWNDDKTGMPRPTGIMYGFIAQDLQTVWPTKVKEDHQGYLQTAYGDYDPMFVEAIRALHDQNQALQIQVEALSQNLETVLDRLDKLTNDSKSIDHTASK